MRPKLIRWPDRQAIGKAIRSDVDVRSQRPLTAREPAQPSNPARRCDCCRAINLKG
nr:MAG TPA: hypothetical protein [Caudoviricetes sp.]